MKVAIIGAGASGLSSIKSCLEYGFHPICFEKTDHFGGLWKYKAEQCQGEASVMQSTVINTSKEIMAFSDFPPPKDYPNFMHNTLVMKYFEAYAKNFNLIPYIQFGATVQNIERCTDFEANGKWKVTVLQKNKLETSCRTQEFDCIMLCTGHHAYPHIPQFEGLQSKFNGQVIHSHDYKDAEPFRNKTILILGLGNSAGDICVELAKIAKKTIVSTRRGAWLWPRIEEGGYPRDISTRPRFNHFLAQYLPTRLLLAMLESKLLQKFDHQRFGLQPSFRIHQCHPLVNDELPYRLLTGQIRIKPNIREFTERGVVFNDGTSMDDIDCVILATGYSFQFPFLEKGYLIDVHENNANLYKHIFPPNLKKNTLAIIGLIQPLGATIPMAEMQSRVACHVFANKYKLPKSKTMLQDIENTKLLMQNRYIKSRRHTIQVDYIPYMDMLADMIHCKPNLKKLITYDPRLALAIMFGPAVNYQYRIFGAHSWKGARQAILTLSERVEAPFKSRNTPPINKDTRILQTIINNSFKIVTILIILYVLLL